MSLRTTQVPRRLALVLAVGLSALALPATADSAVDKARGFYEKGDLRSAGIELKDTLQRDPGNAEARLLLGEMYLKLGVGPAAEKELRRAQELGLPPSRWRLPLVRAMILQGNYSDALAKLDGVTDLPPEQEAAVWAQRGNAQMGLGRSDEARESYEAALKLDQKEPTASVGMIRLALESNDEAAATRLTDELLKHHPDDVDGLLIRSELHRKAGNAEAAAEGFAHIIQIDPNNVRGYLGRATTLIGLQRFDEAVKDLDSIDALQSNIPMANYLRGVIKFQEKQWDEAADYLQRVLTAVPSHIQSKLLMGIIRYSKDDFEIADEYLTTVVAAMPGNLQARKVLGAARIKMREPAKAIEALQPAASTEDAQLLALLGSAYMLQGDEEKGQELLAKAVEISPDVAALRTQLALSLLAGGQTDKAVEELQSAVNLDQEIIQADVLLVLAHLKNDRFDEALKASTHLEERNPDSPIPYNLTGLAMLSKGDLAGASARFEKALEVDPNFTTAEINLARIDLAGNNLDAAAARYQRVLDRMPKHLGAMLGLAALAERRRDNDDLVHWLTAAQDANPTATQPGLLLTRYYISSGDYLKALSTASNMATRFPDNTAVQQMVARAQTLGGDVASAIRTFDQLAVANPKDPQIFYLAGGAKWKAGNLPAAADSFRKAIALKADFTDARVALASVLLEARDEEAALEVARGLETDDPKSPLGFRITGTIQTQAKRWPEAIRALEQAARLADSSDITRQLADAYTKAGRTKDAITVLEDWVKAHADDRAALAMLAITYQTAGQSKEALKLYEALYQGDKTNFVLLNNMAWLYHEMGDPRAKDIALQAYTADPNRPEIADTYGWILFNSGEKEKGLSILQQAFLAYPSQTEIGYHVAVALSAAGRNDEAVKLLRKLLRDNPDFPQAKESRALLDRLGG